MEKQLPQPGWRYRHFKGGLYQIVTLALNTETGEDMVVYQALYDDFKVYVRPLSMFLSETDFVKYPDSTQPVSYTHLDVYKRQLYYVLPYTLPSIYNEDIPKLSNLHFELPSLFTHNYLFVMILSMIPYSFASSALM